MNTELPMPDKSDYLDLSQELLDSFCKFIPVELCHYTAREKALEKILESKKIRLGQFAFTNDPRESKEWIAPTATWSNETIFEHVDYQYEVNRIRKEEWLVLCMACHNNPNLNFYGNITEEYDHIKYGFSHSRMWSQYADNYQGVCFVFDGRKLDKEIRKS